MANVFDYLEWRGDVPMTLDPFNHVDNLVLAQLAYTNFHGVLPEDGTPVPIETAYESFFQIHTKEEILSNKSFTARAPFLMEEMARGARFRGMMLSNYINEIDPSQGVQLSAITYDLPDGTRYVAFRGTDGTLVGWKEDFYLSYMPLTPDNSYSKLVILLETDQKT